MALIKSEEGVSTGHMLDCCWRGSKKMNRKMSLHHFESQSLWVLSCSLTPHNDDTKPVDNFRERHT